MLGFHETCLEMQTRTRASFTQRKQPHFDLRSFLPGPNVFEDVQFAGGCWYFLQHENCQLVSGCCSISCRMLCNSEFSARCTTHTLLGVWALYTSQHETLRALLSLGVWASGRTHGVRPFRPTPLVTLRVHHASRDSRLHVLPGRTGVGVLRASSDLFILRNW